MGGSSNERLETHEDLGKAALDFGLTELQIRVDKHLTHSKCLKYGEPYRLIVHFLDSSSGICSKSAYMGGEEWTNTDEVMTFFEYIKKAL